MEVYLDNSATTACFEDAAQLMHRILCEDYGNPSSLHHKGVEAEAYLRYANETFAKILKVNEKEIFFTSGGTESDNIALVGAAMANHRTGRHLITTKIEHPAVLQPMSYLENQGFEVTYLSVDRQGKISLEELEQAVRSDTILVSVMYTNNEIGSVQPIAEAGALIKRKNPQTLFHVDAVQGFGKTRIYPGKMHIDMLSASGHKIHGPKGVGLLYVRDGAKVSPIMYGGGQQRGLRSGTENLPGIAGFAKAAELVYQDLEQDVDRMYGLRAKLTDGIKTIPDVVINGCPGSEGAPHIVSASFRGVRSEVLLHALEERGIYVSAGSACAAHKPQPSATLRAIGVEKELLEATIRFSLSGFTTEEEIAYTCQNLEEMVPNLRRYTRH
ncbi:MAG: cysteine desulfurase [Lachnospiraceae bacterium]|nr:cysteine desulfurase [Lachnospiraceae bacterium]RKI82788.1 cysteine desulfurase [bacterium 1xD42-87]